MVLDRRPIVHQQHLAGLIDGCSAKAAWSWLPGITYQLVVMTGLVIDIASICGLPQPSPLQTNKRPHMNHNVACIVELIAPAI
jgi:hypothetical protein